MAPNCCGPNTKEGLCVNDQLDAQLRYIIRLLLYVILYMFRATLCSSSGDKIIQ